MLYPEIDKLMKGIDSRYSLVILAAKRARQLASESSDDKTVSRAINEIVNGKIKIAEGSEYDHEDAKPFMGMTFDEKEEKNNETEE